MAYNNGFPIGYQQIYYPQQYQPVQQYQPQQPQQMPQNQGIQQMIPPVQPGSQIQNGGFVTVRSESEARSYPVAPGTSVTFKHETAPYCYTKTMGFNQFEAPRFEKFRLVKEEDDQPKESALDGKDVNVPTYAKEEDLGKLAGVVKSMSDMLNGMKADMDTIKTDFYGAMGRRKPAKKSEAEVEE